MPNVSRLLSTCLFLILITVGILSSPVADTQQHDDSDETDLETLDESDLILTPEQENAFFHQKTGSLTPFSGGYSVRIWSKAELFYQLDPTFTDNNRNAIRDAFSELAKHTCIKFTPKTANTTYWVYYRGLGATGCSSVLGRRKKPGMQKLSLGKGCRYRGVIMHETMHALGAIHEQSNYYRDQYVKINWNNIKEKKGGNFKIYNKGSYRSMNVPYSFRSIMHYGSKAFSKNKLPTIQALDPSHTKEMGNRRELDFKDKMYLNQLYGCADHCQDKTRCGTDGYLDKNCKCVCKDGTQKSNNKNECQGCYGQTCDGHLTILDFI